MLPHRLLPASLLATAAAMALAATSAHAVTEFNVRNLVSDGFVPAKIIDPNLVNPWGVSFGPTSPMWVSDNGKGVSTLYNAAIPSKIGLTVSVPDSPTGQVFNGTASSFKIGTTKPVFLFDTEDGTIQGWAGSFGTTAQVAVDSTAVNAVYKGLAIDTAGNRLYAADFHNDDVEMYTNDFSTVNRTMFVDPGITAGYAPFNVQVLDGQVYVTYALQDAARHDDVAGPGNGFVDAFNLDGTFNHRIVSAGGEINSPWGLAIAPSSFREFAGDLLVGNFGDGTISAFDGTTFEGKLLGRDGNPLHFGDLWALTPGNGTTGSKESIYFTAGIVDEAHGLFGQVTVAPEPESWALMILGFGLMGAAIRTRRRTVAALA